MYWNVPDKKIMITSDGLTLTWDVLKWDMKHVNINDTNMININMRCIEMWKYNH